ncbi:8-amino-7-oxononanoate synthase [Ammonifex degensii KC4]|uniref:8-amino-7-ketopelargonate synthase n=2 Tax=Ammonifex degensii TaxID=42838 RepID=C9R9E2_AMMDK|nr:8-amino-7-oxononanoate synthase [Ammonifex degensii KC4]
MKSHWQEALAELEARKLRRQLHPLVPLSPTCALREGRECLLFCTNNYLGLTHHPRVIAAVQEAVATFGTGSGASPLISGYTELHQELAERLARFKGAARALLFPSGYSANVGCLSALAGPEDVVFVDRLGHASLLDGIRLSGAKMVRFRHNDLDHLESLLSRHRGRRRFLVTEGVFSMDGDTAPLAEMANLARREELIFIVDDAHGTGVLGPQGRGTLAAQGVDPEGIIIVGTLSKALAAVGGFVAGGEDLIEFLLNRVRSFIFSTSLPPPVVAAATSALRVLEEDPELLESLRANIRRLAGGLRALGIPAREETPIFPVVLGSEERALKVASRLLEQGFYVPAIRPPAVPPGTARLRVSVSALHTPEEIDSFLEALAETLKEV